MSHHELTEKIKHCTLHCHHEELNKIIRQWLTEKCEEYWGSFRPESMRKEGIQRMNTHFGLTKTSCGCGACNYIEKRWQYGAIHFPNGYFCPSCGEKLGDK